MSFSVVMSVYKTDDPEHFRAAVVSVLEQSVLPDELVISVDGPVGPDLERVLESFSLLQNVSIVRLAVNQGLGGARHAAIQATRNNIVAVMDSDDLSVFNRFELQLEQLRNSEVDIVGGFIEEFDVLPGDTGRIRAVPLEHTKIIRRGRWRQPMNHVTIMFRKSIYEQVGGYHMIRCVEDYDLFHRMFVSGVKFKNISEILVHVRSGTSLLGRRRGMQYLRAELALFRRMRSSDYITVPHWIANSLVRIFARLMPSTVISIFYKKIMRSGG